MKKTFFLILWGIILYSCNIPEFAGNNNFSKIRVGVFNGNGASPICVLETMEALRIEPEIEAFEVSSADIQQGKLNNLDILIFPGGSGSKELNNLGIGAAKIVKKFVREQGKAVIGICAGGYLLSTTPTYPSLQLIDAKNIDRKHYARGRGLVEFSLTTEGEKIFPELNNKRLFLQYYDGPVLVPLDSNNIKYTELAKYVSDIHANKGIPSGVTPGKTFMLFEKVGKGKVFVFAGHPEATPGYRWMLARAVYFLYYEKINTIDAKWIKPENYSQELLFTDSLKKIEKKLFWKLLSDTSEVKINALQKLYELHSRPSVRWSIGLLRDTSPKVRKFAAEMLMKTEYTPAANDIKTALNFETDSAAKEQLKETFNFLTKF